MRKAVTHLDNACRFAETAHDPELECWTLMRRMMVTGEMDGAEAAIAMLPDIRRRVTRLADPTILATLHLWVAEFESKRGLLTSAARHIQLGRSILGRHPNVWLEGSAAIDDFCLSYLRSDVIAASKFASDALRLSAESGHAITKMAACTNLAHLHLASGELATAEQFFQDALASWRSGGAHKVAILDGLAQLALERKDFAKCETYLNEISRIEDRPSSHPGYYQSWSFRTHLQLLIAQGRITEAEVFMDALQPHLGTFHPALRLALNSLHVELLLTAKKLGIAESLLEQTYSSSEQQSPELLGQLALLIGKSLTRSGRLSLANTHFARAARIFTHLQQLTSATAAKDLASSVTLGESGDQTSSSRELRADVLGQIRTLFELRDSPDLFAQEVVQLFQQLDCAEHIHVLTTHRDDNQGSTPAINAHSTTFGLRRARRLRLGFAGTRELILEVASKADLASRIDCISASKIVESIATLQQLQRANETGVEIWPADELASSDGLVTGSASMQELLKSLKKIGASNLTVLITGETGTGKDVLAREIHRHSRRASKLFVPFNCSAVPRDLVESQLFGYRKGAFSGAHDHFEGVIRAAEGGTLFLDEIGELPLDIQPKLLRFLESAEVQPLGEVRTTKVDVRVVAASNADIEQNIQRSTFRADLFYRLNVIRLRIPPLRERREEILPLANHFLTIFGKEYARNGISLSQECVECLLLYSWPGNVRQLSNELRRLVALADDDAIIEPHHLSSEILTGAKALTNEAHKDQFSTSLNQPLEAAVAQLERSMLRHALTLTGWRVDLAARALGISRKGLYLKRMRLGMRNPPV